MQLVMLSIISPPPFWSPARWPSASARPARVQVGSRKQTYVHVHARCRPHRPPRPVLCCCLLLRSRSYHPASAVLVLNQRCDAPACKALLTTQPVWGTRRGPPPPRAPNSWLHIVLYVCAHEAGALPWLCIVLPVLLRPPRLPWIMRACACLIQRGMATWPARHVWSATLCNRLELLVLCGAPRHHAAAWRAAFGQLQQQLLPSPSPRLSRTPALAPLPPQPACAAACLHHVTAGPKPPGITPAKATRKCPAPQHHHLRPLRARPAP